MKLFWCRGINPDFFSKLGVTTKFLPEFDILLSKKIATENFLKNTRPKSPRQFQRFLKIGHIREKKGKTPKHGMDTNKSEIYSEQESRIRK